jgi:hypothetical protein
MIAAMMLYLTRVFPATVRGRSASGDGRAARPIAPYY